MKNLSTVQEPIWLTQSIHTSSSLFNIGGYASIVGMLNIPLLVLSIEKVLKNIDVIEIGYDAFNDKPLNDNLEFIRYDIETVDLSFDKDSISSCLEWISADMKVSFDVSKNLLKVRIISCGGNKFFWYVKAHHLIFDGYAMSLFFTQVSTLYSSFIENEKSEIKVVPYTEFIQYNKDYVACGDFIDDKRFWLNRLDTTFSSKAFRSCLDKVLSPSLISERKELNIPRVLFNEIDVFCTQHKCTVTHYFIALLFILNRKYANESPIIGIPVFNRTNKRFKSVIGTFVNVLPFSISLQDNLTFIDLLVKIKNELRECYKHSRFPLHNILQGIENNIDIINVLFSYQKNSYETKLGDLQTSINFIHSGEQQEDLVFHLLEYSSTLDLTFSVDYKKGRFSSALIERLLNHFYNLLSFALASPEVSLGELNYLSAAEEHELLETFNPKAAAYVPGTVLDLLKARHDVDPDAIALVYEDRRVSYRWLDEQSTLLSVYLREECQLVTSDLVGVQLPRTEWLIVCLLGVLKSGCAYVPVDPGYPQQRIDYLLADSGCKEVLDESFLAVFQQAISAVVSAEEFSAAGLKTAVYGAELSTNSLAYLIYTSGSTGLPKGVMVSHGNMYSFLKWSEKEFRASDFEVLFGVTSVCFDLSVYEIFYPLISGKLLRLLPDALSISSYLSGCSKVLLNTVPSVVGGLLREGVDLRGVSVLNMAGEPIPGAYLEQLDLSVMEVRNLYGPSEDTTYSTCYRFDAPFPVLIGKPIDHTQVYILDAGSSLVPVGVSGEICLGGLGVSLGYLNRAELTGEKFVANPFKPGERMYRTGDLGRWDSSGFIEYQGRLDEQVKIRGYRVELGEIESRLVSLEGISSAVVLARSSGGGGSGEGEQELVAYLAGEQEISVSVIREQLGRSMPNYLVPNYYVQVDAIPLTSNGKVDKKKLLALAVSGLSSGVSYIAPRNPTEYDLAVIWSELLGRAEIGVKDNFFDLGGHSLKAMRLLSRISAVFSVGLSIKDIFSHCCLEDQAKLIGMSSESVVSAIPLVGEGADYVLSSSLKRLWLLSQFEGGNAAYNMPGVYEIRGSLDPVLLEMAFNAIISRHEILRTVFREDGNGEVRQVVLGAADQALRISITDLGDGRSAEVVSLLGASVSGEFDLGSGPLLRADLYRLGNDHWLLSFVMHHIISDGWSLGVLMRELSIFYNAGVRGEVASVAALPLQYKDYSVWEQSQLSGELLTAHRSYWLAQFSGDLPVLELPADRLRPEVKSYRGGSVYHQLDQRLSEELKAQSHSGGGTLFMGLIAGVTGLLYRYSHQQDIVIGSPIAGRHHASLEDQIGLYLNTLALRMRFEDDDSFRSLLDKSREVALGAYEHQVYPFDELINELPLAGNGLFNVMVVLQNNVFDADIALDEIHIGRYAGFENKVSKFDLLFEFVESSGGIHLEITYNSDIYDEVRISRMAVHLEQFLLSALASPEVSLGELNYLSAAEEHELLETFNPKAVAYVPGTVLDLLKARHDVDPDAIALVYEDRRVSYRWLDEQSTLLSVYLREECQLVTSDLVGVQLPRTEWLIVCLLGVLKSGCAYVPVDPGYPQQRIDYLLADSGCKEVLDESFLAVFQQAISAMVSAEEFSAAGLKTAVYGAELSTNSLAYLIYTSGSTGLPKGVMVSHGNMYSFLKWSEKEFRASDFEVLFGVTSVCFDLSVYEIFYPLISGKLLRLLPDALSISSYLSGCSKVLLNTVPSVVGGLLREGVDLRGVSVLNMAGEPIPGAYLEQLDLSVMEVRNLYGPSEDTTYSTCYRFDAPFPVLIGKPIDHTQVYILDAGSSLVPVGVSGEICLGGLGVSLGYLNRAELTGEKFVANPFKPGERMYRTGDLGRWDSSGFIEYQGRLDEQVKIRGYRVELGEIESRLVSLEGISSAVVLARSSGGGGSGEGEQELVAYLAGEQEISVSVIREQLGRSMPNYLVPNYYVQVDAIPLTSNGKVDKKKLLALAVSGLSSGVSYIAPRNPTEYDLAVIWSELLGRAEIGVKDNFFDLGGHSLKAMRLLSRISAVFSVGLSIKDIFSHCCLEDQAKLIGMSSESVVSAIPLVGEGADYVLSSSLKRLWLLSQFEGGNAAYNMPGVYEIRGSLDPVLLEMAFNAIISRHEILRTVFREDGNGEVRQVVLGAADQALRISITDLGDGRSAEVVSLLGASVSGEFDLGSGPLLRADLYRLGNDHWLLSFVMHHIISDGWSLGVLMRELSIFYNAGVRGEVASVAALPLQYKDYSVWEQSQLSGELLTAHRSYWLAQFSGDLPVLELPADRLRPEVKSYRGGSVYHQLDQRLSEELKAQSHSGGGTLFMGLIAGVTGLLYRYSHQQDIVIGSPIAGRHHASLEDQIGLYLNTLALRMRFEDDDSFRSLLDKSREVALGAYEHQVYPFDELINELPLAGNGLFNVMVVLQNNVFDADIALDEIHIGRYAGFENKVSKFDLLFEFVESSGGIHLEITYNSDIYDEVRISRMAVHLEQFLLSALASPEVSLGELNYLSAAEEHELLETFNPKAVAYVPGTVLDLLKARHDVDPDAIALVYEDRRVSYRWLDEQSTLLSVYLREECQLVTSDLVGVQLPRTEWLIVCLLGVLKSGCAYVPVDPGYPQQRIDYLLADSGCKEVLDESFLAVFQQAISAMVSAEEFSAAGLKTAVYGAELSTNSLAYLIYTSGSTGLPKGVMVSHGNMYSFLKWSEKEFRASDFEVLFGVTSVCFDLSVYEIFYPLISGKLLRLLPDALSISSYLSGCSKVLLNTVPSVVGGLLREGVDLRGVSVLNMAGEPIPGAYLEQLDLSVMEVRNLYGPSEDTTYSTCYRFDAPFPVLIGKPIDHTQVYILDAGSSLVPVGVSGEICLGGLGVSLGYLNRAELTGEKFVANPFKPGERMYRTGDLGRWDSSGFIEYQGRLDEQVKIRGYRVELGEIESRLVSLEGISSAVVLARSSGGGGSGEGEQELVAYLAGEQEISVSVIREQLGRSMPNYLVPNYYVQVDAIPLTSNGKVDKKKLLALAVSGLSSGVSYIAPRNPTEHDLAVIWSELLGRAEIGVKDNFFDLGGHSLKAMALISKIAVTFSVRLNIQSFFKAPTIENISEQILFVLNQDQQKKQKRDKLISIDI
ncbi:amino acid adenylation domain-containing protein [Pedobacter sp. PAMC26386]|nr:amino acid adenylation domain-containing protein [Pedobacter sp. PAMC26386]